MVLKMLKEIIDIEDINIQTTWHAEVKSYRPAELPQKGHNEKKKNEVLYWIVFILIFFINYA